MKRFITFGSIDQFRTIIKNVQHTACYIGWDEELQRPNMNRDADMPLITATASEKIHGTNAAVCYSIPDGFWVQSRKNIITPEKDNAACAFNVMQNETEWMWIILQLASAYDIDLNKNIISVYFEWAGGNIQKNSALSGFDKQAIVFQHFKVSPIEPQIGNDGAEKPESASWHETCTEREGIGGTEITWLSKEDKGIKNIMNYDTWEFEIDFAQPLMSQNAMIKLVEEVIEPCSPIGKEMGKEDNIGEGVVVTFMYKGSMHRFKVKGEKHSASKVKTLKPVDEEAEQAKIDFVNNHACKGWRLEQAWQTVFGIENSIMEPSPKATGDFLRAVINDVIKEESDIMAEMGLEPKTVNSMISKVARQWFMAELDKDAGIS